MSKKVKAVVTAPAYHDHVLLARGQVIMIDKDLLKDCRWAKPFVAPPVADPMVAADLGDPVKEGTQDENIENSEGNVL